MSVDDEQEQLIQDSTNRNSISRIVDAPNTDTESSPSPSPPPHPTVKTGIFRKLRSKSQYSALPVMNENAKVTLNLKYAQSEQLPETKLFVTAESSKPTTPNTNTTNTKQHTLVRDPESPSIASIASSGYLHATYSYSPRQSKDDLDLHTHRLQGHQPRASAVNPISIPLHASQRDITLTTDFDIPHYKRRTRRSFSQQHIPATSPSSSKSPRHKKNEIASFDKTIAVHNEKKDVQKDVQKEEQKDIVDIVHAQIEEKIENKAETDSKPPFLKKKTSSYDTDGDKKDKKDKKVSVKNVLQTHEEVKKRKAPKVFAAKVKLKKEKSVFDAFKKGKQIDLSNIKNLPMYLLQHLNDDSSDHAIESILTYIRESDEQKKDCVYEQLVKDKEFVVRICDKLLSATDAKHNEIVCIWLYDFFAEDNANARLFAVQFIPCLIWCVLTRSPKCVSGVVAALLSLYKKECNIFDKLWNDDDVSDLYTRHGQYGVHNDHNIFPKFHMPDLDLPSIYHEPDKSTRNNNKYKPIATPPQAPTPILKSANDTQNEAKMKRKSKLNKRDMKEIRDFVFPSLNQANLSTNLHLIYVALQVFNHYITRVSKPSICLEQMCAVIAKLCSSGIDASQFSVRFPDSIHFAFDWKWYTEDMKDKKQHEKYILPSPIISQFLSSIRYSLKQPKTSNIAKFALAQVHKRGHIDMIPEIILQTTSMLHSAFMDGLAF